LLRRAEEGFDRRLEVELETSLFDQAVSPCSSLIV
jgi:hypothetical protein